MHIQSITFDRVFSVCQKAWKSGTWTEFGFEAGETKVYAARVSGHPVVLSDVPLAVAMPEPNKWDDIYGWANLRTGEIFVAGRRTRDIVFNIILLLAFDLAAVLPSFWSWASMTAAAKAFTGCSAVFLHVWIGLRVVRTLRSFSAHRELAKAIVGTSSTS